MRINMDCIRDILLCIEENTGLQQRCLFVSYAYSEVQEMIRYRGVVAPQFGLFMVAYLSISSVCSVPSGSVQDFFAVDIIIRQRLPALQDV